MNETILAKAKAWADNLYFDDESRNEIRQLINNNDEKELTERFYKDLEFGTGGMRSIRGQGLNRINIYTIRKSSQAVADEVLAQNGAEQGVAISYDSRIWSEELSKEAAGVFAANGIHVYLYGRLNPVPLLSFSVRYHKAKAGIMVTASHNPPEYNGYKVFWEDGAQITPPNDKNIISRYNKMDDFSKIKHISFKDGIETGFIHMVGEDVEAEYFKSIYSKAINPSMCEKHGNELNVVYTPIHGTGLIPCKKALYDLGFKNISVIEEQAKPDGNFPTVSSPNPENPEALELAVKKLIATKADLALGTDPDTDRVGMALHIDGKTVYLNGNQIGLLMLHYILTSKKETGTLADNSYFVKTIVTTPLQDKIAKAFGVQVENTLTGFKWICGRMNEMAQKHPEKEFLFATEESFGYLNHEYVRDKDGVSSITLLCEVALHHKLRGKNLLQALDEIYEEYGFSNETLLCLNYYGKEGAEKIDRIMDLFRSYSEKEMLGSELLKIEDYKAGSAKYLADGKTETINLPSSNVLGYIFKNGNRFYLRPSGTEPKIKFYIMIAENEGDLSTKKEKAEIVTSRFLDYIKAEAEKA